MSSVLESLGRYDLPDGTQLELMRYSPKSFLIRGNTNPWREYFKALGSYNSKLIKDDKSTYIFSNNKYQNVLDTIALIQAGKALQAPEKGSTVPRSSTQHQTITYVVDLPVVGRKGILHHGTLQYPITVVSVDKITPPFDEATIQIDNTITSYKIGVVMGKWKILGIPDEHHITF
jgi:hypothetical protein